jgi:hypothetical protein
MSTGITVQGGTERLNRIWKTVADVSLQELSHPIDRTQGRYVPAHQPLVQQAGNRSLKGIDTIDLLGTSQTEPVGEGK